MRKAAKRIDHQQPGSDAVQAIVDKHSFVAGETEAWRTLSLSTDFPA